MDEEYGGLDATPNRWLEFGSWVRDQAFDHWAIQACDRRNFTAKPLFSPDKKVDDCINVDDYIAVQSEKRKINLVFDGYRYLENYANGNYADTFASPERINNLPVTHNKPAFEWAEIIVVPDVDINSTPKCTNNTNGNDQNVQDGNEIEGNYNNDENEAEDDYEDDDEDDYDDDDEDDYEDNHEDNDEYDGEDDDENDDLDAECDFSVYLEQYLKKNKGAWNNHAPDVSNWPLIRCTGNAKKKWPQKMAIEAAYRYFDESNALHTKLLDDTIDVIKEHYTSQKERMIARKEKKSSQKGKKDSRSYENESSLVRTTKAACEKAWQAYSGAKAHQRPWEQIIPKHAQILACQFVAKNGQINSSIATYLTAMSLAHLLQVRTISTGDGDKDGEVRNLALSAVNTAANALQAAEASEERFKKRIAKPFQSLALLAREFNAIGPRVDTLEKELGNQTAELKAELDGGFKLEQARLKEELEKKLKKELKEELEKEQSDPKGRLDKDLAEFKKTQLGKGQVTGSGSTPSIPTPSTNKRGSTSSEPRPTKKTKLDLSDFDFDFME
ncbi:uncharacterized protein FIESC28_07090 [Fusarium coffeatum]|uniref:Uncharacterized protein n=1 Tax=Fusarium coffeatum TaxID=231269 RepID=A0A366RI72_9HYPO|nr:uncharacterized protein FIESC28_07090 [Fusarium coffeatum]RBR16070.1 hypothetical protein FIESC28_07090 [Fusarium coffeatum]